jgi:hypothetical protein
MLGMSFVIKEQWWQQVRSADPCHYAPSERCSSGNL